MITAERETLKIVIKDDLAAEIGLIDQGVERGDGLAVVNVNADVLGREIVSAIEDGNRFRLPSNELFLF